MENKDSKQNKNLAAGILKIVGGIFKGIFSVIGGILKALKGTMR